MMIICLVFKIILIKYNLQGMCIRGCRRWVRQTCIRGCRRWVCEEAASDGCRRKPRKMQRKYVSKYPRVSRRSWYLRWCRRSCWWRRWARSQLLENLISFLAVAAPQISAELLPRNCFLIPLERAGGVQTRSSRSTPFASLSLSVCPLLLLLLLLQVPQLLMSAAASKHLQLLVDVSTLPWFALIWCKCEPKNRTRNEKKPKNHNTTHQIQKLATEKTKTIFQLLL
jgi:hypothetical protein